MHTEGMGFGGTAEPGVSAPDGSGGPPPPVLALLAGGLGTRLGPATSHTPKALVTVAGRAFIEHQLALLRAAGIREVVICTGHLGDAIEAHVREGAAWGLAVRYSHDGEHLLGTAGALRQALPLLGREFLVLYGDSYLETDYLAPWQALRERPDILAVMAIYHNRGRWDRSNILARNGAIVRYDKRHATPDMEYIDYGLGAFRADAFTQSSDADLADLYRGLAEEKKLGAWEADRRFFEIGTPAGLQETERHILRSRRAG